MEEKTIAQRLSSFYMFSELQQDQIEYLAKGTRSIDIPNGSNLFNRGDQAHGFYILLKGQIKLGVASPQGGEKIIALIQPEESFGEAVLFLEQSFPIYAQATKDSTVLLISRESVFNILDNDATVARRMLAAISARNRQLVNDIESISLQNSTQRLIGYLLEISADSAGAGRVKLPTNKLTISSMLNIAPETFSRVMNRLKDADLIQTSGKEIIIVDIAKLRNFGYTQC